VTEIADLGVDYLWLPPPSKSVAPQGYLPSQLYDVSTPFGSREDLVALTAALKEASVIPMADIVINHRCADKQDDQGNWNIFTCVPGTESIFRCILASLQRSCPQWMPCLYLWCCSASEHACKCGGIRKRAESISALLLSLSQHAA
jgi:hypothetical protein